MALSIDPTSSASTSPSAAVQTAAGAQPAARSGLAAQAKAAAGDTVELSPAAAAEVGKLKTRDAQVRAHEAAHMAAGGSLIQGGPTFDYQQGPDGKAYAVGGEVSIDTSPVAGNPRATIAKAQQIQAAALAPADPSGQDESVASQAASMASAAAAQLAAAGMPKTGNGKAAKGSLLDITA